MRAQTMTVRQLPGVARNAPSVEGGLACSASPPSSAAHAGRGLAKVRGHWSEVRGQ